MQKTDTFVKNADPQNLNVSFLFFLTPPKNEISAPPEKSKFHPLVKIKCEWVGFQKNLKPKPWHVFDVPNTRRQSLKSKKLGWVDRWLGPKAARWRGR